MKKISVIGAGNVGATAALKMAQKELGNIVLIDVVEGVAQGKALDIQQSMPLWESQSSITGTSDFSEMKVLKSSSLLLVFPSNREIVGKISLM